MILIGLVIIEGFALMMVFLYLHFDTLNDSEINKGTKVLIIDINLPQYNKEVYILFKISGSKSLYAVSKNKDAAIAEFYVGKSQFEVIW